MSSRLLVFILWFCGYTRDFHPNAFEFLTHSQYKTSRWLAESSSPSRLMLEDRSKETLLRRKVKCTRKPHPFSASLVIGFLGSGKTMHSVVKG